MAKEKFCEGKLADAVELFEEASVQKTSTMYPMVGITETAAVYLAYIRDISPSLYSDYQDDARPVSAEAMIDPFCRYYLVLRALDGESGSVLARLYLERASAEEGQYAAHIRARVAIGKQNYQEAYGELRSLLTGEGEVAAPMMYFIFSDLERCCSAMSDIAGAYGIRATRWVCLRNSCVCVRDKKNGGDLCVSVMYAHLSVLRFFLAACSPYSAGRPDF